MIIQGGAGQGEVEMGGGGWYGPHSSNHDSFAAYLSKSERKIDLKTDEWLFLLFLCRKIGCNFTMK